MRALVLDSKRANALLPPSVSIAEIEPKAASIQDACAGASMIYDLFEPANEKQKKMMGDVTSSLVLAAIQNDARLVLASHLFRSVEDNSTLERDALAAHKSNFADVVVARLPQLYGPEVTNGLYRQIFGSVLSGKRAHWVGPLDLPRSLLYVEDAAAAIHLIGDTPAAYGHTWNIAGDRPITGRDFIELAYKAAGKAEKARSWGFGVMVTARLVNSEARGFLELPYDYYHSFVLDGSEFASTFPSFAFTPHETAIRKTLAWYGEWPGLTRQAEKSKTSD